MIIGIEAVNIRNGGGLNHLIAFLERNNKSNFYDKIIVFTNSLTKQKLNHIKNIEIVQNKFFDLPYFLYIFYQLFCLKRDLKKYDCDLIFVPGTIFLIEFANVLMPQNMLPFEKTELKRFGIFGRLKFILVGIAQKYSLKKANGVIFLSEYASKAISLYSQSSIKTIIPFGIEHPKIKPKTNSEFTSKNPMKLLYVSPLYPYKHHEIVIKVVNELINEGFNIQFKIVGGGSKSSLKSLNKLINNSKIKLIGEVNPKEISKYLIESNVFIFASTCENLPITMLEAMSFGMPIICSNYGVMPEVLSHTSNFFFDPTDYESVKKVIKKAYNNTHLLNLEANKNKNISRKYKWKQNLTLTNNFLNEIHENSK